MKPEYQSHVIFAVAYVTNVSRLLLLRSLPASKSELEAKIHYHDWGKANARARFKDAAQECFWRVQKKQPYISALRNVDLSVGSRHIGPKLGSARDVEDEPNFSLWFSERSVGKSLVVS